MFGFKKKNSLDKITGNDKKTTREKKVDIKAIQNANLSKDKLMDRLMDLRNKINRVEGFEEFAYEVEKIIKKLRTMSDNPNVEEMKAIDWLIQLQINDCENYCNRGRKLSVKYSVKNIANLINSRLSCPAYYTNVEYLEYKKEYLELYVELQNMKDEHSISRQKVLDLKKEYEEADEDENLFDLESEFELAKIETQGLKTNIENVQRRVEILAKALKDIEMSKIYNRPKFDFNKKIEDVVEISRGNNGVKRMDEKLGDALDKTHSVTTKKDLEVNANVNNESKPVVKKKNLDVTGI